MSIFNSFVIKKNQIYYLIGCLLYKANNTYTHASHLHVIIIIKYYSNSGIYSLYLFVP
jgi:hypothetical protein